MNLHVFMESTEEGKKLELSFEQEHKCKVVYKKADDGKGHLFAGVWNPETEYSDDHIIVPLRSVYDGKFSYTKHDHFANVLGSTGDTKISSKTWLTVLKDAKIDCSSCVMDGYFYDPKDTKGKTYFSDYKCSNYIVGGHVIKAYNAKKLKTGAKLYLLPICKHHNSYSIDGGGNGSGFYMMPQKNGTGIKLKAYVNKD